jgi:hypothetical protein
VTPGQFYHFYQFYHFFSRKFFVNNIDEIEMQGLFSKKVVELVGLRLTGHNWSSLRYTCMLLEC